MPPRRLLIAVDDSDASEEAVRWTVDNLYRAGDEVHLIHVVPRLRETLYEVSHPGPGAVDPGEVAIIRRRALVHLGPRAGHAQEEQAGIKPVVHIVKYETDAESIAGAVCGKAEELGAAATVVARHHEGVMHQLLVGSVAGCCVRRATRPLVVHQRKKVA